MKNNTLAMLATISLVLSVAMLISYIDPAVCAGSGIQNLPTCTQAASEHILGFIGFFAFGSITLVGGVIRHKLHLNRERKNPAKK
jgi:hypothetical protein